LLNAIGFTNLAEHLCHKGQYYLVDLNHVHNLKPVTRMEKTYAKLDSKHCALPGPSS
jgi:phage terminase large subunit-like protein